MPPKMHLVIATRADPPLHLSRLRGRGTMVEIGADDLRFNLDETAALLKAQHLELPDDDINTLNTRTEGWAVGLTMASLSLGKHKDVQEFIAAFAGSQRHVMDYLVEEVLRQQPSELQLFLLQTSVLRQLNAALCDYVTERHGSRAILENLASAFGGFLIPLDETRRWYRYQHLFADLLRHQAEMHNTEEQIIALHHRASQWFEEQSLPEEAVHHAAAAKDWERAARLIGNSASDLMKHGEWIVLLNWLQAIPTEVLRVHPQLYSHYANALITTGHTESSEAALDYLERTTQQDAALQGEVALFQLCVARLRGDSPRAIEMANRALTLLPPDNPGYRARASMLLGFVKLDLGLLEEARYALANAYEWARQVENHWVSTAALVYLGLILKIRGELNRALLTGTQAVELAGPSPAAAVPR